MAASADRTACPRARSTFSSIRASASRIEARVCSTLGPSDAVPTSSPASSATLASWASCSASCRASWKSCSSPWRPDRASQTIRRRAAAPRRQPAHRHPASSSPAAQRARPKRPGSLRRPQRDCPWAYAHPEKCVQRLAPTWIREARARHDSTRVPPGMRLGRASDPAML